MTGADVAALFGGILVALIAAGGSILAARESYRSHAAASKAREQTDTLNGTPLGPTVTRIEGQLAELRPLLEWARLKRAEELLGRKVNEQADVHRAEAILHGKMEEGGS